MIFPSSTFLLVASVVVLIWAPLNEAQESEFIVGGVNAKDGELPYQVSLQYNGRHNCGGSLLHNCWVLTAAHCVINFPLSSLSILAGTTKLNSSSGVRSEIKKSIPHDDYKDTIVNDIALLRLKDCVPFNDKIAPVQLGTKDIGQGDTGIVSGWGYIDEEHVTLTNDLKKLEVTTISNKKCNKFYGNIVPENLCTLNGKGRGFCQGDSGGPLVEVESNTLMGLVSANVPCAQNFPDIYTRISSYISWIRNIIRNYPKTL